MQIKMSPLSPQPRSNNNKNKYGQKWHQQITPNLSRTKSRVLEVGWEKVGGGRSSRWEMVEGDKSGRKEMREEEGRQGEPFDKTESGAALGG